MENKYGPIPQDGNPCQNCKHRNVSGWEHPCSDCYGPVHVHWNPAEEKSCKTCRHADRGAPDIQTVVCHKCSRLSNWEGQDYVLEEVAGVLKKEAEPGMTGQYDGRGGIQPIEFIRSNNMNFLEGNVIKYVYRYPFKGGLESLRKARTYLDWLIAYVEGKNEAGA